MLETVSFVSIMLIAVGLSADCFAIALGASMSNRNYALRQLLQVAVFFGLFQAIMPVLGWLAGDTVVNYIGGYVQWVAFGLLLFVSGRMLWESFRFNKSEEEEIDISRGFSLVVLSVATSIDSLVVGLSFAFLKVNIALASSTIGVVAFVLTMLGFIVGRNASKFLGRWAEIIGAVILLAVAFKILLS